MPLFSVVMAVYNRETLVGAAIESVLNQPNDEIELIVVDDGSTDGTLDVLKRYGNRIRVIKQENAGPSAARNRGIKEARGDYILFLDSDDLWLPWTLETYQRVLYENDKPSLLIAKSITFEHENTVTALRPKSPNVRRFNDYLSTSRQALWFGASSLVVRSDALRAVGGFTQRWMNAEDLDLCLKLGTAPHLILMESPETFAYRKHEGSAVSNMSRTLDGVQYLIMQERASLYPGGGQRRRQRLEIITRHVRPVALECLRRGYKRDGWQLYRQTFFWHALLGRAKFLGAFPILAMKSREEKR